MKVIGLTGGVACGKSTVAKRFRQLGIEVIDTDEIAHDLLASDPGTQKAVEKLFGTLDRSAVRAMVFENPQKRSALEHLLHPRIGQVVDRRIAELRQRSTPAVIIVVPLLFETGWDRRADTVIAVVADEEVQIARLEKRDGTTRDLAKKMIAAQLSNQEKRKRAAHVIENNGGLDEALQAVDRLAKTLRLSEP